MSGKNYVADQGAAVVLDAHNGQVVAMASQPTYNPDVWVGGITKAQLSRLYSSAAGTPLLSRAFQGQLAPGSTWKPIMTAGAFSNGYSPASRLDCSSGVQVGNRLFKNYESASFGYIDFAKALQISCDTFFYRVGLSFWQKYGSDESDVNARDPLVDDRQGVRLRLADRHRPAGRGQRPHRGPQVEEGVLGDQQGLLLQARQGTRLRLHPPVRPGVLRRRLHLPRR